MHGSEFEIIEEFVKLCATRSSRFANLQFLSDWNTDGNRMNGHKHRALDVQVFMSICQQGDFARNFWNARTVGKMTSQTFDTTIQTI